MNKKIHTLILAASLSLTPLFASAQLENTQNLINSAKGIVSSLIVLAGGLALLYFVYGLAKFIRKASEGDVKEGKNIMMWGIIALFVMVSVWGIIQLLASDLGVNQNGIISPGNGNQPAINQGYTPFEQTDGATCSDTNPDNPC